MCARTQEPLPFWKWPLFKVLVKHQTCLCTQTVASFTATPKLLHCFNCEMFHCLGNKTENVLLVLILDFGGEGVGGIYPRVTSAQHALLLRAGCFFVFLPGGD